MAAVTFHNALAEGQANAGTFVLRAGVQALEDNENPLLMLGRDADPVVGDRDTPGAILFDGGDVDQRWSIATSLRSVLGR